MKYLCQMRYLRCIPVALVLVAAHAVVAADVNRMNPLRTVTNSIVEVAPEEFVTLEAARISWKLENNSMFAVHAMVQEKEKFFQKHVEMLSVEWRGRNVFWVGVGVPISLRAIDDKLHLIVFDRDTDFRRIRFRYFAQDDHGTLREISPRDYPKSIATENLWLETENGTINGRPVNPLASALEMSADDVVFRRSLTAKIWLQLHDGTEYYKARNTIPSEFLSEFKKMHKIVPLTVIKKAPEK